MDSYLEDSAYDRTRLLSQFELAFALPQATRADEANIPEDESWKDKRHWSGLPFMADEALKRGYDLPLPFGVGVSYVYLERLIEVRDVQIGINGAPLQPVDRLSFEDTPSQVHNVMARFDVWLLPFLNVYLLGGRTENSSTTTLTLDLPVPSSSRTSSLVASRTSTSTRIASLSSDARRGTTS